MGDLVEKLLSNEDIENGSDLLLSSSPQGPEPSRTIHVADNTRTTTTAGTRQPDGYRDVLCAGLFVAHCVLILYLALYWGLHRSMWGYYGQNFHVFHALQLCLTASALAVVLSLITLRFVLQTTASYVVPIGFVVSCSTQVLAILLCGAVRHYWWGMWLSVVCLASTIWYARSAWKRLAYSVANLTTALEAIRAHQGGVLLLAVGMMVVVLMYTVVWMLAWLGVYVRHAECDTSPHHCSSHMDVPIVVMFLLCFFWTVQVCKNLVHVTVAGVVGTYLLSPSDQQYQEHRFWSPTVGDAWVRASTWSLGSVCLGSLLTATFQVLFHMCQQARRTSRRRNAMVLLCVTECVVGFLERLVAYFNKWSYCYVGLYGYDYLQAGQNVGELFRARGWTTLIADDLIQRALSLASLGVAIGTGTLGLFLTKLFSLEAFDNVSKLMAFWLPGIVGWGLSYVLLASVVLAAVDTVIVVFAEAPQTLEQNHPGLYRQMVVAWRQVYPDEFTM